jgi:choice-of-anchor B domain-containing protein
MIRPLRLVGVATGIALLGSALSFSHDEDGKALDRQRPNPGPGFTSPLALDGSPLPGPGGQQQASAFTSFNVRLLAWLPATTWGATGGNSCTGYVSPSGREYALIGLSNGTGFVDITVPGSPMQVGFIAGPSSLWRDVRTYKTYAYAVSEGGSGIQVIDLANIDSGSVVLVGSVTGPDTNSTHTVEINKATGYLYRSGGGSNGLRIYNLEPNPANPAFVASWSTKYVHEVTLVNYTSGPYAGKEIAFACSGDNGGWANAGVDILDVTNKQSIVSLSRATWPNAQYSHQCTLSEDRKYMFLNDELYVPYVGGPTACHVFDVQNLAAPVFLGKITNNNPAIPHNEYIEGNLLYQSNYRSGLRVLDTSSPLQPVEVAWFDTYPADDDPNFNGLWNNYPYLPSGVVLGSDIESGLFVWWVGEPLLTFSFPHGLPGSIPTTGFGLNVRITESTPGALAAASPALHYNAGAGWASVPMTDLGGGLFRASFPAFACNTSVQYYVTANSTNNIVWSDPEAAPTSVHVTNATCPAPPAVVYCTAKVNSLGCTPAIGSVGTPSVSAGSGFTVAATNVRNQKAGLMIYGVTGRANLPFSGGTLCFNPPVKRTPGASSSGNALPANDCSGTFELDFNAFIAGGTGHAALQVAGTQVECQWWGRDPGFAPPNNTMLSDALEFILQP